MSLPTIVNWFVRTSFWPASLRPARAQPPNAGTPPGSNDEDGHEAEAVAVGVAVEAVEVVDEVDEAIYFTCGNLHLVPVCPFACPPLLSMSILTVGVVVVVVVMCPPLLSILTVGVAVVVVVVVVMFVAPSFLVVPVAVATFTSLMVKLHILFIVIPFMLSLGLL